MARYIQHSTTGGQKYVCLQATEITEALDVSSTSIRILAEGELIEVYLWRQDGIEFLDIFGDFVSCMFQSVAPLQLRTEFEKRLGLKFPWFGPVVFLMTDVQLLLVDFQSTFGSPRKDGDVTRIRGKAKSDGVHGWITISSPNSTFLQPS